MPSKRELQTTINRLEAAERERDLFKREQVRLAARCDQAQNERNEYAAVVEKVLSHDPLHGADSGLHCGGMAPCIRDILATAPADALREHDAALIEGLADKWHADNTGTSPRAYNWLREKARQRREEQP